MKEEFFKRIEEVKNQIVGGQLIDSATPIIPDCSDEIEGIIASGFVWETEGAGNEDCLVKTSYSAETWLERKILHAVEEVLSRLYSESDLQEEGEEDEERERIRGIVEPIIRERFDSRSPEWLIPTLWSEEDTDKIEEGETDVEYPDDDDDWEEDEE